MANEDSEAEHASTADDANRPEQSVLGDCYWVLCGQFEESGDPKDTIKGVFIAIGIATGMLALTAGTTSFLASDQNWPVSAGLFVLGIGSLVFVWFVGLHRLDHLLVSDS